MENLLSMDWLQWSIILIVALGLLWVVFTVARKRPKRSHKDQLEYDAMRELEEQYTEGNISKEEYDRRKQQIKSKAK